MKNLKNFQQLNENATLSEFREEFLDALYLNGSKDDDGKYTLTLSEATAFATEIYNRFCKCE